MAGFRSELMRTLDERGFIHQCTDPDGLDALALKGPITGYIGFDLTADSLHVGSLYPLMLLRILQQTGHRPIVLLGGGTTKVGDPSGKDASRQLLTPEQINANKEGLGSVFARFVSFGDGGAMMVDNSEWLDSLNYLQMLREVGRHFTINRMLTFDSVKARLEREQPLTFLEFNYMILQAYDFVELASRYGCRLQMGASDQWGNIINGVELHRRIQGDEDDKAALFGLTCPLLTDAQGNKMGKSAAGAIWLNADKLSHYDFWQYWRNVDDADVARFLRLFTELPAEEREKLSALSGSEVNEAKKVLATEITALVRGRDAAEEAARTAQETFELGTSSAGLPTVTVSQADWDAGIRIVDLLVRCGLADSNGAAKRHLAGGAVRVNDERVDDSGSIYGASQSVEGAIKVSLGKKQHVLVKPE
ncbi:MAG: tyrosine--tRNA ligase [Fimbriimonadaceae bacterium]|nr:tyrosine--tRNA ligase [Fimbriimonadaceae bacterium]